MSEFPSNLSFRRGVDVSSGFLYSLKNEKLIPVKVEEMTSLSAMSNFSAGYDKNWKALDNSVAETKQNSSTTNIQRNDLATLDGESDTLVLKYGITFHNGGGSVDACSSVDYATKVKSFIEAAKEEKLHDELAIRYIWNIINGRTLWRNGYGIADKVVLTTLEGEKAEIKWGEISQKSFPGKDVLVNSISSGKEVFEKIISGVTSALKGDDKIYSLNVSISVILYNGAEVWPSQDFVNDSEKKRNGVEIGRHLSSISKKYEGEIIRHGTIHPQKIGNAIRTIDEWYNDRNQNTAISVEIFGYSKKFGQVLRKIGKNDAYALFKNIEDVEKNIRTEEGRRNALFLLAIILRGGVFGVSSK